jgi:hypothetical protein
MTRKNNNKDGQIECIKLSAKKRHTVLSKATLLVTFQPSP